MRLVRLRFFQKSCRIQKGSAGVALHLFLQGTTFSTSRSSRALGADQRCRMTRRVWNGDDFDEVLQEFRCVLYVCGFLRVRFHV